MPPVVTARAPRPGDFSGALLLMELPEFDTAKQACDSGTASLLEQFVFQYQPDAPHNEEWRGHLGHLLREVTGNPIPHNSEATDQPGRQVLSVCLTEGDNRVSMRIVPGGLDYRHFGVLVADLLVNVASMYRVSCAEVLRWTYHELEGRTSKFVHAFEPVNGNKAKPN